MFYFIQSSSFERRMESESRHHTTRENKYAHTLEIEHNTNKKMGNTPAAVSADIKNKQMQQTLQNRPQNREDGRLFQHPAGHIRNVKRTRNPSGPVNQKFPSRIFPDEYRPTAAVVGAGIAGLHCAWELSRLGFNVTVFEQYRAAGEGASKYDSGLVGRDVTFTPVVWRAGALYEYMWSLLPFAKGTIVPKETPLGAVMRESWRTWFRGRRNVITTEEHIQSVAGDLTRESADIIDGLMEAAPERFAKCVVSQAPQSAAEAKTAPPAWRCLDTGLYCKELKKVLEEEYGVDFKFRQVITRLTWRINQFAEFATSVVATDLDTRESSAYTADLIVVAAGSMSILQRNVGAGEGYPLPLLSVAAHGLDVPKSLVPSLLKGGDSPDNMMPYHLSERFMLRAGPTPPFSAPRPCESGEAAGDSDAVTFAGQAVAGKKLWADLLKKDESSSSSSSSRPKMTADGVAKKPQAAATFGGRDEEPRVRISGLISLLGDDVRRNFTDPSHSLVEIAPRLARSSNSVGAELAGVGLLEADDPTSGISGFRYARGITPDGLPISCKAGNAKNVFVCCGFGDDATMLAPGSARYMSEIIQRKRCNNRIPPPPPPPSPASALVDSDAKSKKPGAIAEQQNFHRESQMMNESLNAQQRAKVGTLLPHELKSNPLSLDRFYKFDHWMQPREIVEWQRRWYKMEKTLEGTGQSLLDLLYGDFMDSRLGRFVFMQQEGREPDS